LFSDDEASQRKRRKDRKSRELQERQSRSASISLRAQIGACSKKLDLSSAEIGQESSEDSSSDEYPVKAKVAKNSRKTVTFLDGSSKPSSIEVPSNDLPPATLQPPTQLPAPPPSPTLAPPTPLPSPTLAPPQLPQRPHSADPVRLQQARQESLAPVAEEDGSDAVRPRRRAASAAASSLKEVSLNKKMRQGDPTSNSVYKDFVPEVRPKRKSSSGGGRGSGAGAKNATKRKSKK
jgi:hypothetical protein